MTEKNIFQKRYEAKKLLNEKAWKLENQNTMYKTISIDQMKESIEEAHDKIGILVQCGEMVDFTVEKMGEKGNLFKYRALIKFIWINPDKPEDRCEIVSMGEAMDAGDKGVSKLYTNALKNMYKIEYNIAERGDDIDSVADPVAQALKPADRTNAVVENVKKRVSLTKEE